MGLSEGRLGVDGPAGGGGPIAEVAAADGPDGADGGGATLRPDGPEGAFVGGAASGPVGLGAKAGRPAIRCWLNSSILMRSSW